MADPMYEQLKAKQAAAAAEPDMGMMPPPETDAAMDMGMMEGEMPMPTEEEITMMADEGRGGDVTMGHLTPGELVIPLEMVEDPEIMSILEDAFNAYEMDIERYTVGSEANSINPDTGYPEFYDQFFAAQMQLQSQQFQMQERMANRDLQWQLQAHADERSRKQLEAYEAEAEKNRLAAIQRSQEAANRQAQQQAFADAQRIKKRNEARAAAKMRRHHELTQSAKQDRKREMANRGKTFAAMASAESLSQAKPRKPGRGKAVSRVSRRPAPVRAYTTPGSGAGKYTAAGKRPV